MNGRRKPHEILIAKNKPQKIAIPKGTLIWLCQNK